MKNIFIIALLSVSYSIQSQIEYATLVSENKDTLYIINDLLGQKIYEAWDLFPSDEKKPIRIYKSKTWIINEKSTREECNKKISRKDI
jgi:hypothetical protein